MHSGSSAKNADSLSRRSDPTPDQWELSALTTMISLKCPNGKPLRAKTRSFRYTLGPGSRELKTRRQRTTISGATLMVGLRLNEEKRFTPDVSGRWRIDP